MENDEILQVTLQYRDRRDEQGELRRGARADLVNELDALLDERDRSQHYWILSTLCAQKSYFRWYRRYPEKDLRAWLEAQRAARRIDRSLDRAIAELARLHKTLDTLLESDPSHENRIAIASGMAVWAASRDAAVGSPMVFVADDDLGVIVEHRDVAHFACQAYANGSPDAAQADPERRQRFWSWYLEEAIPKAYAPLVRVGK